MSHFASTNENEQGGRDDRWGDGPTAERGGERRSEELPQQVAYPDGAWRRERPFGQFCHVLPREEGRAGRGGKE